MRDPLNDPTRLMSLAEFMAWTPPPVNPIVDQGVLNPETNVILFGEAKSWKSTMLYDLARRMVEGNKWLKFNCRPCAVLFAQAEMTLGIQRERLGQAYADMDWNLPFYLKFDRGLRLDTTIGKNKLAREVKFMKAHYPHHDLVVILDPLYKMMAGRINDEYEMRKFTNSLDELNDEFHFATILAHHTRLTKTDDKGRPVRLGMQEMLGSSILQDWCDTAISITLPNRKMMPDDMLMEFEVHRHAHYPLEEIKLRMNRDILQPDIVYNTIDLEGLTCHKLIGGDNGSRQQLIKDLEEVLESLKGV